jgi:hypothetical protein
MNKIKLKVSEVLALYDCIKNKIDKDDEMLDNVDVSLERKDTFLNILIVNNYERLC